MEAQEFVGDELVVWGGLKWEELTEKGDYLFWPEIALVATAGFESQIVAVLEPESAELIETRFTYSQKGASLG